MPRVPIFDGVPTANLGVSSPPMMQGGQIAAVPGDPGRALQQIGQSMTAIGVKVQEHLQREQDELSTATARSNYNSFRSFWEKTKNGVRGHKLDASTAGGKAAMDAMKKEYERILQGITDENAKTAFDNAAQGLMISAQSDIDKYVYDETEKYKQNESALNQDWMEKDAANAWVEAYQAAGAPQDPQKLGPPAPPPISGETYMRAALANANEQADKMGLPEGSASRNELILGAKRRVSEDVVNKLLAAGMTKDAYEHLSGAVSRGEFDEESALKLQSRIREKATEDSAIQQVAQWDAAGVPHGARMQAARDALLSEDPAKRIDAQTYEKILDEVGKSYRRSKEVADGDKLSGLSVAQQFFFDNKMASISDFRKTYPREYDAIVSNGGLPELMNASKNRAVTDPAIGLKIHTMTDSELRLYTKQGIEAQFGGVLEESDMKFLRARYEAATGESSKEGTDIIGREQRILRGFADVYKDKFPEINVNDPETLKNPHVASLLYEFKTNLQSRITAFEDSRDGAKARTEDIQKIMDGMREERAQLRLTTLGVSTGAQTINVNSIPAEDREFVFVPTPAGAVYLKDIPMKEEKSISSMLNSAASEWVASYRAKGYDVSILDVPLSLRPTPANVAHYWVLGGAIGAPEDSPLAVNRPKKAGPPAPEQPDISTMLPTVGKMDDGFMKPYQSRTVDGFFKDRIEPVYKKYKLNVSDRYKSEEDLRMFGGERAVNARAQAESELRKVLPSTEEDAYKAVRKFVYEKHGISPDVSISESIFGSSDDRKKRTAAEAELNAILRDGAVMAADKIDFYKLTSESKQRREELARIEASIKDLTSQHGPFNRSVLMLREEKERLELLEMKTQAMRSYFEDLEGQQK